MLTGVVDEHGATGNAAAIPGYTVAGKTGTAQVPGPHGYTTGKYVASFVGMVPVKKPRLVVLVVVNEPTRGIFGGTVAAPAFAEIAKFDLQYLGVAPDHPVDAGALTLRLTILHTNDIHGHQERLAQIATIVEREKARFRPHRSLPRRGRRRGHDESALEPDEGHGDASSALDRRLRRGDGRQRLLAALRSRSLTEHARASAYPQLLANFTGIDGPVPSSTHG